MLRWGAQLAYVRMCLAFSLQTCIVAPNLRTCLALHWGAQLADVPCIAFGRPSCGRVLHCIGAPNLWMCGRALLLHCRCALGRPTCGHALHCIGVPNLRTCLVFALRMCVGVPNLWTCPALRWVTQLADVPYVAFGHPSCRRALRCVGAPNLGEAILKSLPPSQNLFLSILQLVFYPSSPLCGRFRCG
jgi:hypothetical protein